MKVQIRTSNLSELQIALEEQYEEAVYLLRQNEFNAEYVRTVVSSPSENPGFIRVSAGKP